LIRLGGKIVDLAAPFEPLFFHQGVLPDLIVLFFHRPGKSTLLSVLGNREVPIPDHIDIFHLSREMPASDKTALQCVMEVDEERVRLEKLAEQLVANEDDGKSKES